MRRFVASICILFIVGPAFAEGGGLLYDEGCRQGACWEAYVGDYDWSGAQIHVLLRTVMTYEDDDIEAEEWISAAAVNCAEPATKFMGPIVTDEDFVPLDRNPPFAAEFRLNLWTAICDNLHLFPPYQ